MSILPHRQPGYELLQGHGIEVGAFNAPASVPEGCQVEYCDAQTREQALAYFPELKLEDLVEVSHICDLDNQGLSLFQNEQFDFVIFIM